MGKAERTRQRLRHEALRLFVEQGYDETRVAEIARAAGVTEMTFFRHFPSKELVVIDDPYDPAIAAAVAAQPVDLSVLERVRRGLAAAWADFPAEDDPELRLRLLIGAGHRGLRARMREGNAHTEDLIVATLTDQGVPRVQAAVAAGAVLGALTAALLHWASSPEGVSLGSVIMAALDQLTVGPVPGSSGPGAHGPSASAS